MTKTFVVEFERTDEDNDGESAGTGLNDEAQLQRELQAACDAGLLVGTFRVRRNLRAGDVLPNGEVVLTPPEPCALPPPDALKAFFAELRQTAQDSLMLLRVLGMPSNAKVVAIWRKFAAYDGSDEDLDKAIEAKAAKLEALDEVLREVSGVLHNARSVESDLDDAIEKAENAVREARR